MLDSCFRPPSACSDLYDGSIHNAEQFSESNRHLLCFAHPSIYAISLSRHPPCVRKSSYPSFHPRHSLSPRRINHITTLSLSRSYTPLNLPSSPALSSFPSLHPLSSSFIIQSALCFRRSRSLSSPAPPAAPVARQSLAPPPPPPPPPPSA